jgi:hypothetical protein
MIARGADLRPRRVKSRAGAGGFLTSPVPRALSIPGGVAYGVACGAAGGAVIIALPAGLSNENTFTFSWL